MKVFVTTYKAYSDTTVKGNWLDLEDYTSKEEFMSDARELHSDETDPEFMFASFPEELKLFMSEDSIDEDLWELLALDEDDREIVLACIENTGRGNCMSSDIDYALEAYQGEWDSWEDFAQELFESCHHIPEDLACYIDWELVVRDLKYDYFEQDGKFFRHI